jgi:hypothetical protein
MSGSRGACRTDLGVAEWGRACTPRTKGVNFALLLVNRIDHCSALAMPYAMIARDAACGIARLDACECVFGGRLSLCP